MKTVCPWINRKTLRQDALNVALASVEPLTRYGPIKLIAFKGGGSKTCLERSGNYTMNIEVSFNGLLTQYIV